MSIGLMAILAVFAVTFFITAIFIKVDQGEAAAANINNISGLGFKGADPLDLGNDSVNISPPNGKFMRAAAGADRCLYIMQGE